MFSNFSLSKKNAIVVGMTVFVFMMFIVIFTTVLVNRDKINVSPEKTMFDQLEASYKNKSYIDANRILQEMNSTNPNAELTKKANIAFKNLDQLAKKAELEKQEMEMKIKQSQEEHEQRFKEQQEKSLYIGDSKEKVIKLFGKPDKINRTVTSSITREQWVYGDTYLYLEKDKVISWQESK